MRRFKKSRTDPVHEVAHLLSLRHPHPKEVTGDEIDRLVGKKYDRETLEEIQKGMDSERHKVIGGLMVIDGYDSLNTLDGIIPGKNIMSWLGGNDVTCDQINSMIENVQYRNQGQ